jgi:hypothetical protein
MAGFWARLTGRQERAAYVRTNRDLLINENVAWIGFDTGGGAYPIGPNGPYGPWTAPATPAVLRATSLITTPLTAAPFRVLDASAAKPLSTPRWITDPMLLRPDERYMPRVHPAVTLLPRGIFWTELLRSAIWWGEGAFLFTEDAAGAPQAGSLRLVPSWSLSTERDSFGALCWTLGDNDERVVFDRDGYVQLGPVRYRLLVLRNPHSPVDTEGRSQGVFAMSPDAFGLGAQLASYQSGQFRAGVPNGYLKVTGPEELTQTTADALKKKWLENHGGDQRSIAVLNATTEFKPINLSPVDAALDQVKRLNIADVAFAFALDPITLGAGLNNSATYNNLRDAWSNHKDFGLASWIAALQDTLSALLPGSQQVAVTLDGFANPSPKERLETYQLAQTVDPSGGLLDEIRLEEGRQSLSLAPPAPPAPVVPDAPEEES